MTVMHGTRAFLARTSVAIVLAAMASAALAAPEPSGSKTPGEPRSRR